MIKIQVVKSSKPNHINPPPKKLTTHHTEQVLRGLLINTGTRAGGLRG